jgi:hypothetical protein
MVEYYSMLAFVEIDENGKTRYKVLRMKPDGTASNTPFSFKTESSAREYIKAHGF